MNVGAKIRSLRMAKMMTQSELSGTEITRTMISYIENGVSQPSLSTVSYLAGRLGVSVGFLLAEASEEPFYRKMNSMENIKKAFSEADWMGCRGLCLSIVGDSKDADDELLLLLAQSCLEIGVATCRAGKLHAACRYLDEALEYAARCLYPIPQVEATAEVYFRLMRRISSTLYSEILDESRVREVSACTPVARYADALDALDAGNTAPAEHFAYTAEDNPFYPVHLRAKCCMARKDFGTAHSLLQQLLEDPTLILTEAALYFVLTDLEVACREIEDYKGAYRYANERVQLLEQLLKN